MTNDRALLDMLVSLVDTFASREHEDLTLLSSDANLALADAMRLLDALRMMEIVDNDGVRYVTARWTPKAYGRGGPENTNALSTEANRAFNE